MRGSTSAAETKEHKRTKERKPKGIQEIQTVLLKFNLTFNPFIPFYLELKEEQCTSKNNCMKRFLNSEAVMVSN